MIEVRHYLTTSGHDVFAEWFDSLRDAKAQTRILARIARLAAENFGDCKPLRAGVWEMRIDWGPGYRVYYAMAGRKLVILLCGGDKRTQSSDIDRAVEYWNDHQERSRE